MYYTCKNETIVNRSALYINSVYVNDSGCKREQVIHISRTGLSVVFQVKSHPLDMNISYNLAFFSRLVEVNMISIYNMKIIEKLHCS